MLDQRTGSHPPAPISVLPLKGRNGAIFLIRRSPGEWWGSAETGHVRGLSQTGRSDPETFIASHPELVCQNEQRLLNGVGAAGFRGAAAVPQADLHIHAIGGGDREFLRAATGVDIAPVERVLRSMAEMHDFVDEKLAGLFSEPSGRALAYHATFAQARKDGVTRLEIGEDAWAITLHEGSAHAVWTMLSEAHRSRAPNIDWIPQLGISRHCPVEAVERWIEPFLELGVYQGHGMGDVGALVEVRLLLETPQIHRRGFVEESVGEACSQVDPFQLV